MKSIVLPLMLFICAAAVSSRLYFPEEERVNDNRRFVQIPDDDGQLHLVDLKAKLKIENPVYIEDITLYLQTQANPNNEDGFMLPAVNFNGTIDTPLFDPSKFNVFTFHGWGGSYLSKTNRYTRDGILANHDVNIFMVDYSRPGGQFYTLARETVNEVSDFVADFINKFMATYNIPGSQIMLVGQSLGGQVIGLVGARMTELPQSAVALDPAGPLFYVDEPWNTLDATDATHVHIIHTNGGMLGVRSSIGHADYRPNGGGLNQAGCGPDLAGTCAHYRAYIYWNESLLTGGFRGVECTNYDDFKAGLCNGNREAYMGGFPIDLTASGDYYLDTAGQQPYALG